MTDQTEITVKVPRELADELQLALAQLDDHLIGRTPTAIESIVNLVSMTDTRAIQLVGASGSTTAAEETDELTEYEIKSIAQYEAWAESAEGAAEIEAAEAYETWRSAQAGRTAAAFDEWIADYAEEFMQARRAWWRTHNEQLHAEYARQTNN